MSFGVQWLRDYAPKVATEDSEVVNRTFSTLFRVQTKASACVDSLSGAYIKTYDDGTETLETVASVSNLRAEFRSGKSIPLNTETGELSDASVIVPSARVAAKLKVIPDFSARTVRQAISKTFKSTQCAFSDHITAVTATDTVHDVEDCAFMHCKNIERVMLRALAVSAFAFVGCTRLSTVALYDVTTIGEKSFIGCITLHTITWDAVTEIKAQAFDGCTSLASIPETHSITIGDNAFRGTRVAALCASWPKTILSITFTHGMAT